MDRMRKWITVSFFVTLAAVMIFAAGFGVGRYSSPALGYVANDLPAEQQARFRVFWEAWRILENEFYHTEPLDYQEMIYGATKGLVRSLGDSHTTFLTPTESRIFSEDVQGTFEGIGAEIDERDGHFVIVRPLPNSPAERAGLRPNDEVLQVDGVSVEGLELIHVIALIRGPRGTVVRLLILREGEPEPFEVSIRRETIEMATVESEIRPDGIAYLRLYEFNDVAGKRLEAALHDLVRQNPRGLILDLRGNPGGFLHVAQRLASQFLSDGIVLIERDRDGHETQHPVKKGGLAVSVPLVVLVDRGTASASEIVAGALQDYGRAVLIGERTFGKGSVQKAFMLSDSSSLRVTVTHWYTPKGRQIEGQGLTPDIEVKLTDEDLEAGRDPQLDRAVSYLLSGK